MQPPARRMTRSSRTLNLDLTQQLVDYGAYHSKPANQVRIEGVCGSMGGWAVGDQATAEGNQPRSLSPHTPPQLIHFIFVPLIALTLCVWLALVSPSTRPLPLPSWLPPTLRAAASPNAALAAVAAYSAYYMALDPGAGVSWAAVIGLPTWLAATHWALTRPASAARETAVAHAASWAAQVVFGHALIEGRRPALIDSLAQSLVLAPLFAWVEFLFAVGYRPPLKRAVDAGVAADARARRVSGVRTRSVKRRV